MPKQFIPFNEALALVAHKTAFCALGLVTSNATPEEIKLKLSDPEFALKFRDMVIERRAI